MPTKETLRQVAWTITMLSRGAGASAAVEHHHADDGAPYSLILDEDGWATLMLCQHGAAWDLVAMPSERRIATAETPEGLVAAYLATFAPQPSKEAS